MGIFNAAKKSCVCRVSIKESSVAKLGSVCRRIYRIFSHAYFHHRQIFDEYEVSALLQRVLPLAICFGMCSVELYEA